MADETYETTPVVSIHDVPEHTEPANELPWWVRVNNKPVECYQLTWTETCPCEFQDEDGVVVQEMIAMTSTLMFTDYNKAVEMMMSLPAESKPSIVPHDDLDMPVWSGQEHHFRTPSMDRGVDN